MLDKGRIIKAALLKLGKNNAYNDNKSDEYKIAEDLLQDVIDNIATDTSFLFNSVTTKLTSTGKNDLEENRFNLPVDNLNIIRANTKKYRIEGEFLYSPEEKVYIQYCRKIQISEFPENLFNYLVNALCYEMCLAFNAYKDLLSIFDYTKRQEKIKIIAQQGYNNNPWG